MSESLIDRFLVDMSGNHDGAMTRSLADASTSGFIRQDAPHWSIEAFIPLDVDSLVRWLIDRRELDDRQVHQLHRLVADVDSILQQRSNAYHARFRRSYTAIDPDRDSRDPNSHAVAASQKATSPPAADDKRGDDQAVGSEPPSQAVAETLTLCEELLQRAGYCRLGQADVEQCAGVASQWGVPLLVNFDLFDQLVVFARGDIVGTRVRRRWRTLYRRELVEVPIYQRLVVIFRLHDDDLSEESLKAASLHLRMFKNIPKQDIDMLLPGTRVRISGIDRVKIIVPSLGGFLMSIRKIAQYALLFAALALHWTAILVGLVIGYAVKSAMSYFQTKNRYQLHLTRNLYFQKLDTNSGVVYRVIQQAHRQSAVEMILAYYSLLISDAPISTRKLRRRCERLVREAIDVEVDFDDQQALQQLEQIGAACHRDGLWTAVSPHCHASGDRCD